MATVPVRPIAQDPLIAVFSGKLLARGREGGREAAQLLRSSVETFAKRFIVGVEPSHIVTHGTSAHERRV